MLVITRKTSEVANLYLKLPGGGHRLLGKVMLVRMKQGAARIGFEFAQDVVIARDETRQLERQIQRRDAFG